MCFETSFWRGCAVSLTSPYLSLTTPPQPQESRTSDCCKDSTRLLRHLRHRLDKRFQGRAVCLLHLHGCALLLSLRLRHRLLLSNAVSLDTAPRLYETDRVQTTPMAPKRTKSHALQLKALPAAQIIGNVSITACVTIRQPSSMADTAVPTRAGRHLAVPLIYAHTVNTFCSDFDAYAK